MEVTDKPTIATLRAPVLGALEALDGMIKSELFSDIPLISSIVDHIISSGGKRLRPLLVLLSALACGYKGQEEHIELAAVIEFIHTATLLHDDVVDKSDRRRGRDTANALFGNQASILVGDFLYSRAFQLLIKRANVPVTQVLAATTNRIAEGEVLQLAHLHDATLTKTHYYSVIQRKTAELFQAAAHIGALIATNNPDTHTALTCFGNELGIAYQIKDDILDYIADSHVMGKNKGDDLTEGKVTLPLILALEKGCPTTAKEIIDTINNKQPLDFNDTLAFIQSTSAIADCHAIAQAHLDHAAAAIQALPSSPYLSALHDLCDLVINRQA